MTWEAHLEQALALQALVEARDFSLAGKGVVPAGSRPEDLVPVRPEEQRPRVRLPPHLGLQNPLAVFSVAIALSQEGR